MYDTLYTLQERQLQEAAKNNEEAQAVINNLKTSFQQLEVRFKQVSWVHDMKRHVFFVIVESNGLDARKSLRMRGPVVAYFAAVSEKGIHNASAHNSARRCVLRLSTCV